MKDGKLSYFFAILIMLLGLFVMYGWIFHIPGMVQIVPGLVGMTFNTAFCFFLSGILIWTSNYNYSFQLRLFQIIVAGFIFVFALLSFSQDVFNYYLGIDKFFITPWLHDPNPTPGRMAPNTSIGFMLSSLIGFLLPYGYRKSIGITIQVFTFTIFIIALLGMLVYSLKLDFVFSWYRYTRMALHTASGMLLLSIDWLFTWSKTKWYQEFYHRKEDQKIILISGIILLCISMIASLGGIAWLTYMNISSVESALKTALENKVSSIRDSLTSAEQTINDLSTNLLLSGSQTQDMNRFLIDKGLTAIQILDTNKKTLYSFGKLIENPELSVPLDNSGHLLLMWKNGYWLRISKEIKSSINNQLMGIIQIESPLIKVNNSLNDYQGLGASGEVSLCSTKNKKYGICFPTRFKPKVFANPYFYNGRTMPIGNAVLDKEGITQSVDYFNHNVIAAYKIISPYPLAIILKIDSPEVYKPISDQLKYILPLALFFICGGLILLHWQVVPLVRKVVSSEIEAEESRKKLEVSLKKLNKKNKQINALRELSSTLQTCLTLNEANILISKFGRKILPSSIGILYFMDHSHSYLEYKLHWGDIEIAETTFRPNECWALRQGTPHKVNDDQDDLICDHIEELKINLLPIVCYPLLAQGNILGLMVIVNVCEDFLLASMLCEQLAIGVSNIKLREDLRIQSLHDPLTGLYNRRFLDEVLETELLHVKRQKSPLSILIIDIDFFKHFNDSFGHDAGDAVLVALSNILRNNIRAHDFACRFGGEEFIFVMPGAPREAGLERAEQLHLQINALQLSHNNINLGPITISIGIAIFPDDGKNALELIKAADIALYKAKETGRNKTVIYSPNLI